VNPAVVERGHYRAPLAPGFSAEMHPASLARFRYPDGASWAGSGEGRTA
jgi:L-fuconate dehydratase